MLPTSKHLPTVGVGGLYMPPPSSSARDGTAQQMAQIGRLFPTYPAAAVAACASLAFSPYNLPPPHSGSTSTTSISDHHRLPQSHQVTPLSSIITDSNGIVGLSHEEAARNADKQSSSAHRRRSSTPEIDVVSEGQAGDHYINKMMTEDQEPPPTEVVRGESKNGHGDEEKKSPVLGGPGTGITGSDIITGNYRFTDLLRTTIVQGGSRPAFPFYTNSQSLYLKSIQLPATFFDPCRHHNNNNNTNANNNNSSTSTECNRHQANSFSTFAADKVDVGMPVIKSPRATLGEGSSSSLRAPQVGKVESNYDHEESTGGTISQQEKVNVKLGNSSLKRSHSKDDSTTQSRFNGRSKREFSGSGEE